MTPTAGRGQSTALRTFFLAVALLSLAAIARESAAVREGPDLEPRPDALEYGLLAESLVERGRLEVEVGDATYPPRYPPGFPLLASPFVAAGGGAPAAWRAAEAFGILAVVPAVLLGHLAAGGIGALAAGLLVALSPAAVGASTLAMSETASLLLVTTALLLAAAASWRRPQRPRAGLLVAAGATLGFAASIRYTNLAFLLPLLLLAGTRHRLGPARPLRAAAALLLPAGAFVLLLLAYHAALYGHPLHDGYRFWVPEIYTRPHLLFSPAYVLRPPPLPFFAEGHLAVYGGTLLGLRGGLWPLPAAVIGGLGLLRLLGASRSCPVARLLLLACLTALPALFVFHLLYFWQDPRFLVPALGLLAALFASGGEALRAVAARVLPRRIAAVAAVVAVIAAVVPYSVALRRSVATPPPVSPPPPLVERLPGLDQDLERSSLVIVDFPVTLAIPALGQDREILVTDLGFVDDHLNRIALHGLRSRNGKEPGVRHLAAAGSPHLPTVRALADAVRDGRTVYYLHAVGEGPEGEGVLALREHLAFDEVMARPPVTVYRLAAR